MMTVIHTSLKFVLLLLLFMLVVTYSQALASKAVYMIENLGSKQCLSAGDVKRTMDSNNSSITHFKHGNAISKSCSDSSFLNTADFSQQWMVRILSENSRNFAYQIQLAMLNSLYHDANLSAELRGEFIIYFPDKLNLIDHHSLDGNTHSQKFAISDPGTTTCLTNSVDEKKIEFVRCNDSDDFQNWNFTLVNEKLILPEYFNSSTSLH